MAAIGWKCHILILDVPIFGRLKNMSQMLQLLSQPGIMVPCMERPKRTRQKGCVLRRTWSGT